MTPKKKISKKSTIEQIRCVWGVLCSMSSVDQERNNISLFNMIEQFNIPENFFVQQKKEGKNLFFQVPHEVVLLWRRTLIDLDDKEILADFKIKTVDPLGKVLQETLIPFKFLKGIKRLRSRFILPGITASVPGSYLHLIEVKESTSTSFKEVHQIPFEIIEVK